MDALTICKMALAEIGTRSTITSVDPPDGSTEAFYCNLFYDNVRDQVLRAARWNFATITDTLTLWKSAPGTPDFTGVATATWQRSYPPVPWSYTYLLPDNYLYAQRLIAQPDLATMTPAIFPVVGATIAMPRSTSAPFAIYNDPYDDLGFPMVVLGHKVVLATHSRNPIFQYTYKGVDEDLFDHSFVMVMVKGLAAYLAIALTQDKGLAQMKGQEANNSIVDARATNANEGVTVQDHIPDWLSIRGVGTNDMTLGVDFYYPYGPLFSMAPYL